MIPAARLLILLCPTLGLLAGGPVLAADASGARLRACGESVRCRRPPGPPDRDVRPFEGSLGRPCAYRWRETPSGTRRVRICF